jgi:hypothetical protein
MKMGLERLEEKMHPTLSPKPQTTRKSGRASDVGRTGRWAQACASVGVTAWVALAILARMGVVRLGGIELLFFFAPLVIVPLGMELGRTIERTIGRSEWKSELARRLQPLGAATAVFAMFLPPGRGAGAAAAGWLLVCVLMAIEGVPSLMRLPRNSRENAESRLIRCALALARIDLAVGGAWLVASRLGLRPMGIQEPIGLLTAVHFHYAGFATATIAAATLRFRAQRGTTRWLRPVVLAVISLPYAVAAGFVVAPALKMAAGLLFSASVAVLAVFLRECGKRAADSTARALLQVAAGAVFAAMLFAGAYAIADFAGSNALTIPQMARTHGILNAVGFCLPALLGWLIEFGVRAPSVT